MRLKARISVLALPLAVHLVGLPQMGMAEDKHLNHSQSLNAAISKPQPEYPPMAKQLKVEGTVELTAYVSEDGNVEKVETVSGNPILARSAQEALKKWKFAKSMEDGKPAKFVADVSFNFKL